MKPNLIFLPFSQFIQGPLYPKITVIFHDIFPLRTLFFHLLKTSLFYCWFFRECYLNLPYMLICSLIVAPCNSIPSLWVQFFPVKTHPLVLLSAWVVNSKVSQSSFDWKMPLFYLSCYLMLDWFFFWTVIRNHLPANTTLWNYNQDTSS